MRRDNLCSTDLCSADMYSVSTRDRLADIFRVVQPCVVIYGKQCALALILYLLFGSHAFLRVGVR